MAGSELRRRQRPARKKGSAEEPAAYEGLGLVEILRCTIEFRIQGSRFIGACPNYSFVCLIPAISRRSIILGTPKRTISWVRVKFRRFRRL